MREIQDLTLLVERGLRAVEMALDERHRIFANRRHKAVNEALHEYGPARAAMDDRLTREATNSNHKVRKILDATEALDTAWARLSENDQTSIKLRRNLPGFSERYADT